MKSKAYFLNSLKMTKILLVEDDPFLIDIYATKLKEAGFKVLTAGDGKESLKKTIDESPDVVLLDIVLPKVDGWEILKELQMIKKASLPGLQVIILSNLGQKEEVEKGLQMGAVKYLIKAHYTPSEVVREINDLLK